MNLDTGKNLDQVKSLYNTNTLGKNKLRTFFDNVFDKISIRLDKIDILPWHIVTAALVLNAYALLALLKKDFILFILLFISAIFAINLEHFYKNKYNLETVNGLYYSNISEWIIYFSVFIVYTKIYYKYLTIPRVVFVFAILILCNINFTTAQLLMKHNNIELEPSIELWIKPFKNTPIDKIEKANTLTRYFAEEYTIMYILAILIYIEIRKRI